MSKAFNRIIGVLDHVLNGIIILISVVILLISGYSLYDNAQIHRNASDPSLLTYKPVLKGSEEQKGTVWLDGQAAWLTIEDSYIDFPVMQGTDNFEYLNKDPYGEFRISGSIFLDSNNAGDLSDEYSMIYGHHMDHYNMFGSLDLFASEPYFNVHREGWIQTREKRYGLDLFAVVWGDGSDTVVFRPEGRTAAEVVEYINENAVINTGYEPGRKIVALSTCSGEKASSRLIVFGMLADPDERVKFE